MSALSARELRPGLVAFLDPRVLLGTEGCRANVRGRRNLVNRSGPFLLLERRAEGWLCAPLASHPGPDRFPLDGRLKAGPGEGWRHRDSFFSAHQFWIIPDAALLAASAGEISPVGNRQRYAERRPEVLAAVAARAADSDAPFRPLAELPPG